MPFCLFFILLDDRNKVDIYHRAYFPAQSLCIFFLSFDSFLVASIAFDVVMSLVLSMNRMSDSVTTYLHFQS